MKLVLRTILLLTLTIPASVLMAHDDHGAISEDSAVQIANKTVKQMTFRDMGFQAGQLDSGWKSVSIENIDVVDSRDGFYVVRVTNKSAQETVYLKIGMKGNVIEATGTNDF
jgi:hypothetical protein